MRLVMLSALTLFALAFHGNDLGAQIVLWDFEQLGSPPPLWSNTHECIPFDGCDEQQLNWQALDGKLVAPLYDANGVGIVNTIAVSPVFRSVPTLGAGGTGGLGPILQLLIGYNPDTLGQLNDENTAGDELHIQLETVGTSARQDLFKEPFREQADWMQQDALDGDLDRVIVVTQPLDVNVDYRLRIRASDTDVNIATFTGIEIDDIAVTNGVIQLPQGAGDFDFDSDVDGSDFFEWQRGNSFEVLSSSDLLAWQIQYGFPQPVVAAAVALPEPGNFLLLSIGLLLYHLPTVRKRTGACTLRRQTQILAAQPSRLKFN